MRLKEESYVLKNVVVTSHRPTYTYNDGVLKARVENLSNNSADKLIDVLKRMPGVVATDNSIMVNGASPVVVINGVKQHLSNFAAYNLSVNGASNKHGDDSYQYKSISRKQIRI
jgi:hypothetical protein